MKKLKPFKDTSRGGRRQVLLKDRFVASICESIAKQTGYPFQWVFDEFIQMIKEQHVLGLNTKDELYARIVAKFEE